MKWKMKRLCELYNVDSDEMITGVSVNSKDTKKGDIFVCIKGSRVDRHDFVDEAIKNGAVAVVAKRKLDVNVCLIVVDNPDDEVIPLCKKIYNNPDETLKMYAVTGTDGKTSVATITSKLIGNDKCGYIGTNGRSCKAFNKDTDNTTPSPDKLYMYLDEFIQCGVNSVCMEASSEAMLQGRLNGFRYDCIGMTNITSEHLNSHKTLENYVACKKKIMTLVKDSGYCILNKDDSYYGEVRCECRGTVLTYGMDKSNDLQIVDYKIMPDKTDIKFKYKDMLYDVVSPLLGKFNIYNLACSMLMCISQGYDIDELISNVKNLSVDGRLDVIKLGQDFTVMVDYAHTPNGINNLLEFVKTLDHNRIITVIGQAGERDSQKRKIVGEVVARNSDIAIFCYEDPRSEDPRKIIEMMCENIHDLNNYQVIVDRSEAIKRAIDIAVKDDIVLILGKGNETYQKLLDKVIYFNDEEEAIKALRERLDRVMV